MKTSVLVALSILAGAESAYVDLQSYADVQDGDNHGRFLVLFKNQFDHSSLEKSQRGGMTHLKKLKQFAQDQQMNVMKTISTHKSATYRSHFIANLIAVDGDADLLAALENHPDVAAIESNRAFKAQLEEPDFLMDNATALANEWNVDWVNAPFMWERGFQGEGMTTATLDTGIEASHPALSPNYRGRDAPNANYHWWDASRFANPTAAVCTAPCDDNNHGTHCTGTAAGTLGIGVAPGATFIGCKNMARGYGSPESYISCMEFIMAPTDINGNDPRPDLRPHVAGNSYGCPPSEGKCSLLSPKLPNNPKVF
jgi:serine protease AprX